MKPLNRSLVLALRQVPKKLLARNLRKKLEAQDIRLTRRQLKQLTNAIFRGDDSWDFPGDRVVDLHFTEEDVRELESDIESFNANDLPRIIQDIAGEVAPTIVTELKREWRYQKRKENRDLDAFRKRIQGRWGRAIDGLGLLVTVAREYGEAIAEAPNAKERSGKEHEIGVLIRLHARACQVTEEVICLLRSGFADGAMARWRTLHEIAVVALLISDFGEDLARRYALHEIVESRKAALEFQKHHSRLNRVAISGNELELLERSYQAAIKEFGPDFTAQCGWAAHHLQKKNPKFSDLQEASKIDHLRPYYRFASHNVHANVKGLLFRLGIIGDIDVLLAGPSNVGLADPGHNAAISLNQVSTSLLHLDASLDALVMMRAMAILADDIGSNFLKAHQKLEDESDPPLYAERSLG